MGRYKNKDIKQNKNECTKKKYPNTDAEAYIEIMSSKVIVLATLANTSDGVKTTNTTCIFL